MKMKLQYLLAGVVAVAVLFVASAPLRASETDDKIEASFKNAYVTRVYLKDDAIKAESKNGVVTLTGTVANESNKRLAEETAASLYGVDRVDNKLTANAEATVQNSDGWIGSKVKLALLFHRNVNAGNAARAIYGYSPGPVGFGPMARGRSIAQHAHRGRSQPTGGRR